MSKKSNVIEQYETKQIDVIIAKEANSIRKAAESINDKTVFMNQHSADIFKEKTKQIIRLAGELYELTLNMDDNGNLPEFNKTAMETSD